MSTVANFGPHLPILRRYARAMTGSQVSGDACVRAALEAILAAPTQISTAHAPKVELFRLFHAVWTSVAPALDPKLRPDRSALLLTAVEGFSHDEAGIVLGKSALAVAEEIQKARAAIQSESIGQILIIEDESIIAMHLQALVEDLGHRVIGVATTRREAVHLVEQTQPDLVLADIRLADGSSGIDAVADILTLCDVPAIFITAFPERLLSGETLEPTYLITKPFLPETVTATISQAMFFHRETQRELSANRA
ncbi:MAG: hypothetical protein RL145_654 [Pseudomonadota bacterium]|jgi:CheY-like chemotaxis protein/DNA-directed RNA polymerase specialized sigma24 family protein